MATDEGVKQTCHVCDQPLCVSWTDTHGIAQCWTCGAPYRVFHYENGVRAKKEPELLLEEGTLDEDRQCYAETQARLSAVGMGLSFPGGYDVATAEDHRKLGDWYKAHTEVAPVTAPKDSEELR